MQKQLSLIKRAPARKALLALVVAAGITGCASKNPLMDGASTPVAPVTSSASEPTPAMAAGDSGAQTTGPTGARRFLGFISPYRVTIQQGNFVSKEMLANVKEGMTREQVRFTLGTPLLTDIFHADRWDYVFRLTKGNGEITKSRVSVFFKDDRLARYEGGDLPTENDYLARIAGAIPTSKKMTTTAPQIAPIPTSAPEPSKQ